MIQPKDGGFFLTEMKILSLILAQFLVMKLDQETARKLHTYGTVFTLMVI